MPENLFIGSALTMTLTGTGRTRLYEMLQKGEIRAEIYQFGSGRRYNIYTGSVMAWLAAKQKEHHALASFYKRSFDQLERGLKHGG